MTYFLAAATLALHTYFWGFGFSLLAIPGRWRRFWWAFAPCCGLALQSAIVWAGASLAWPGTDHYARWSELLPTLLAVLALRHWRTLVESLKSFVGVLAVLGLTAWVLLAPMAQASRPLTTISIGSCDHADYAAGARVFQEFSRHDRTGLLGQTDVTSVGSTGTYFEFWMRLNHFTPSALLAHNSSICGYRPWQIAGVSGAVIALLNLPGVLLLCRKAVGLRGLPLLGVPLLYGLSPLTAYAVDEGALAQLYAAIGITSLTTLLLLATDSRRLGRRIIGLFLLALTSFWLLAGSYNFILLVALAPGGTWLVVRSLVQRDSHALMRGLGLLGAALAVCAALFWGRFDGIAERMRSFGDSHFGWPIPLQSPEGLLGLLRTTDLEAWPLYPRVLLSVAVLALWILGLLLFWRRKRRAHFLASVVLVVPVLAGWSVLAWRSRTLPTASYDAYKLISVFLPCLLTGLCGWLSAVQTRRRWHLDATFVLAGLVFGNGWIAHQFQVRMSSARLKVDPALVQFGQLEADPQFDSFNLLIRDYWDRLWASHFLLRKPHYFSEATYEGRRATALKGRWTARDKIEDLSEAPPQYHRTIDGRFQLVRDDLPSRVDLDFGAGWHGVENGSSDSWRWCSGTGLVVFRNPAKTPLKGRLRMQLSAIGPRDVYLLRDGAILASCAVADGIRYIDFGELELPPGLTSLTLAANRNAVIPGGGDSRKLSFAVHTIEFNNRQFFGFRATGQPANKRTVVAARTDVGIPVAFDREGWYRPETKDGQEWRWSSGTGSFRLTNRSGQAMTVGLELTLNSMGPREVQLLSGRALVGARRIVPARQSYDFGIVTLRPGENEFTLQSPEPAVAPGGGDTRKLAFALWRIGFQIKPLGAADANAPVTVHSGKPPADASKPITVEYGSGWHKEERFGTDVWRWSMGESVLVFYNPENAPTTVRIKLRLAAPDRRTVSLASGGVILATFPLTTSRNVLDFGTFTLQPGYTEFKISSPEPPYSPPPPDKRKLAFGLFEAVIEK